MTVHAALESISGLAGELDGGTAKDSHPDVPTLDFGPSTAAVQATLAEVLRATAGQVEMLGRTAAELEENKKTYATTEAENADLFQSLGR